MTKKFFILFIFIFLISNSFAATLTMGPQQLDFTNNVNCQTALLKTNEAETLTGKVLFSEDGFNERKLSQHKLTPDERGIEIVFPKEVVINTEKEIEICANGGVGNYHGIILYKIKNKPIQVGIWINATFTKSANEKILIDKKVAKKIKKITSKNLLLTMPIFLIIILFGLIIILKNKR